jgi:hypothetical protein
VTVAVEAVIVDRVEMPIYTRIVDDAWHLRKLGTSDRAIAHSLGVSDKTVTKHSGVCESDQATGVNQPRPREGDTCGIESITDPEPTLGRLIPYSYLPLMFRFHRLARLDEGTQHRFLVGS